MGKIETTKIELGMTKKTITKSKFNDGVRTKPVRQYGLLIKQKNLKDGTIMMFFREFITTKKPYFT